jgi:hypothetical protein
MHRFDSHPNHENRTFYDGPTAQGLPKARRDREFFQFCSPIRRGGAPLRVAAIIIYEGERGNNSIPYLNKTIY